MHGRRASKPASISLRQSANVEPAPVFGRERFDGHLSSAPLLYRLCAEPSGHDNRGDGNPEEEVVHLLSTRDIREGWHNSFDKQRAADIPWQINPPNRSPSGRRY